MSEATSALIGAEEDAAAVEATDALISQGRAGEVAREIVENLSGDNAWLRERLLVRIANLRRGEELLSFLARSLADPQQADHRNAARSALAALATPHSTCSDAALDCLVKLLEDPDPDLRILAATALGESGNAAPRGDLEAALRDGQPNVVAAAAEALGALQDRRSVTALAETIEHSDYWARAAIVLALGQLGDAHAVSAIASAAKDPAMAAISATAIGAIGSPDGLDALRTIAEADGHARIEALRAAARIFGAHPGLAVPDWLREAATLESHRFREAFEQDNDAEAARLLGISGNPAAVESLLTAAGNPDRKSLAAIGIELLPPSTLVDLASTILPNGDSDLRVTVLDVLPPVDDPELLDLIVRSLDIEDDAACAAAAEALARSPTEPVTAALEKKMSDPRLRAGIARTLGLLRSDPCGPLSRLLNDHDPRVRRAAAAAISRCGPAAAPVIAQALEHESNTAVRTHLLTAFGETAGEAAVSLLAAALHEDDLSIRFAAIDALGRSGAASAIDPLLDLLVDPEPEIRIATIRALAEIGGRRASGALQGQLETGNEEIRQIALHALTRVGGSVETNRLVAALDDPEPDVRITAAEAIARLAGADARQPIEARAEIEADPYVRSVLTGILLDLEPAESGNS